MKMSTWNKETQLVSIYFGEYFYEYAPFTGTSIRNAVEEHIMLNQEGIARELLLSALNRVDWHDLAETYNSEAEEMLFDEL
jgi:hypothetical protein